MRIEQYAFLKHKALDYFFNFIRNYKHDISDTDFFRVIERYLGMNEAVNAMRAFLCPPAEAEKDRDSRPGHQCQKHFDTVRELLQYCWNSNKRLRGKVRKSILDLEPQIRQAVGARKRRIKGFEKRFTELVSLFKLSEIESDILLLRFMHREGILESPLRGRRVGVFNVIETVSMWLDQPQAKIMKCLGEDQKLRRYECLDNDLDFNQTLSVFLHGLRDEPLQNSYYRCAKGATLPWGFYGDLAAWHGDILKELVCKRDKTRGLHILLYGVPGTGKTSFALSLARELNIPCYTVVQNLRDNLVSDGAAKPEHRFGALQICDAQVNSAESILVIDEADEMLRGCFGGDGSSAIFGNKWRPAGNKGLLNSILDEVKSTCIWITNSDPRDLDPSSRRRFDYSIRFEKLSTVQRRAIWQNNVGKFNLAKQFPTDLQDRLATKYEVSAGGITLVLQNVANLKPTAAECERLVEKLMEQHCGLMGIRNSNAGLTRATDYALEGLNIRGALPLERVIAAVRKFQTESGGTECAGGKDRPRMNLLLCGPPGAGKTEFVKHLGAVLDTKVVVRMGSDLLSMWVGGTEQNIKAAFAEAETEKAILFLDEIDGLVQSRERATRSWEVTQVNELLHQMENFKGVLVGATNFMDNLDPATLRRFTFKIEFDYLDGIGKRLFFERIFGIIPNSAGSTRLDAIGKLTPGDFRTVRQSLYYLDDDIDDHVILEALERECEMKTNPGRDKRSKIGFSNAAPTHPVT